MKLTSVLPLALLFTASFVACSSDPAETHGAAGAAGSSAGASPAAGSAGVSTSAGSGGQAGASAGAAGALAGAAGASGGSGGGGGSGGSAGASGGAAGSAGSAGSAGASFWGPGGPKKQWLCSGGPYPKQVKGPATNICVGFKYNYDYNEGPTWIASQKAFFFSNFIHSSNKGGDIIKYTPGGSCEVWLHDVGCNGLGVSPSGNLLGACQGTRAVMEFDVATKQSRKVATMAGGKMLDSPNDLIASSTGNVYFSNTTYELGAGNTPGLGFALVRIDPMGVTSVIEAGNLNGVALSPDETKLYVVGKGTWALDAQGVPTKTNGPNPGGDGIAVDCAGTISNTDTNSAFGGMDGMTLISVNDGNNLLSAKTYQMTVPGLP